MTSIKRFQGLGVALITPFKEDNTIGYQALENLLNHLKDIDFLIVFGTTGENPTLSLPEKQAVLQFIKTHSKLPIVLGIGGNNTTHILDQFNAFDFKDIDAILSVTPYYNKPNQAGLLAHYTQLADNATKPIILYNVPSRTAVNLSAETTLKLAEHPNIIGIKEASGNFQQIMTILQQCPNNFSVLSGDDALTLPLLSIGIDGLISVIGNAFPTETKAMVWNGLKNQFSQAKTQHYKLLPFIEAIFADGNPSGIKYLLSAMHLIEPYLRLPLVDINDKTKKRLDNLLGKWEK